MNIQAQVKPLFRLITLTRTSLFITNIITEGGGEVEWVDIEIKICFIPI
jgi:hypothetical protein